MSICSLSLSPAIILNNNSFLTQRNAYVPRYVIHNAPEHLRVALAEELTQALIDPKIRSPILQDKSGFGHVERMEQEVDTAT